MALLLDQDTPFLELGAFAGFENADSTPCANLIAGIGNVRLVSVSPVLRSMLTEQWPAMSSHVAHSNAERRRVERDDWYVDAHCRYLISILKLSQC